MSSFWHLLIDGFKSRTRRKLGALPTTCCRAASAGAHWMALLCNWKFRVHNTDCPLLGMKLRFTTYLASYQIGESHVGLSSWCSWGEMWPWIQPCCLGVPEAARLDEGKFTREEGIGMWRAWHVWEAELLGQTDSMWGWECAGFYVRRGPLGVQEGGSEKAFCGTGKWLGRENLEAEVMGLFIFSFWSSVYYVCSSYWNLCLEIL